MTFSGPRSTAGRQPVLLALLFFAFCYALLTWRSMMLTDAAELFSLRRMLILAVGGGVFWLAVTSLGRAARLTLARVASWIVGGTLVVLVARLLFDALLPADWITGSYALRWTLAWSGYFGLWLMGTLAFRRWDSAAQPVPAAGVASAADDDEVEWLIDALLPELEGLEERDRRTIAERLIRRRL